MAPGYPATVNHAAEAERAAQVMETVIGEDNVDRDVEPSLGGEDSLYAQPRPISDRPDRHLRRACFTARATTSMTRCFPLARPTGQSWSKTTAP